MFEIIGYVEPREGAESDDYSQRLDRAQKRCSQLQLWLVEQGGVSPEKIRLSVVSDRLRPEAAATGLPADVNLFSGTAPAGASAVGTSRIGDLRFTNGGFANPVR